MRVGIIGCGKIGHKRYLSLDKDDTLVACCDTDVNVGKNFAKKFNCNFYDNYKDLLNKEEMDIIIISVINKYARDITNLSLESNHHVLLEKPMGKNLYDSISIYNIYSESNKKLKIGFNHRFHPSLIKSKEIFDNGLIGDLITIKGNYGHGGRPGMEKEWRCSKDLCGGGELLDQGVHLIDLSTWFAGEIKKGYSKISTKFWNTEVEDNAFIIMETVNNVDIQLNVSWTNWKNTFQFEIFGTKGYLKINGLGGSYGKETLEFGLRNPKGGIPKIKTFEYDNIDNSWGLEWTNFKNSILNGEKINGDIYDGFRSSQIIDLLYRSSEKNKMIKL